MSAFDSAAAIRMRIGDFTFTGRLDAQSTPESAALIANLLPLERNALHARWSGEAAWVPLGPLREMRPENATAHPRPGQILLYAGIHSEPELLIPYGACAFRSRAGMLAGSPVIVLDAGEPALREMGEMLLWKGAQAFRLERME